MSLFVDDTMQKCQRINKKSGTDKWIQQKVVKYQG